MYLALWTGYSFLICLIVSFLLFCDSQVFLGYCCQVRTVLFSFWYQWLNQYGLQFWGRAYQTIVIDHTETFKLQAFKNE